MQNYSLVKWARNANLNDGKCGRSSVQTWWLNFSQKLLKLQSPNVVQWYFAARRFKTYDLWWPPPKIKVKKVKVKGQNSTIAFFSRNLSKLQSPNLVQWYFAARRFKTYDLRWSPPKIKVKKVKVKGQKSTIAFFSQNLLKLQSPNSVQGYFAARRFKTYDSRWPPMFKVKKVKVKKVILLF